MDSFVIGILILFALIGYQWGMRRWKIHRLHEDWKAANAALQRNDLGEAEAAVSRCVKLEPLFVPARQLHGHIAALQGKFEAAEDAYKMAAALQPREGMGYFQLGLYYAQFRPEQVEAAVEALRQAVQHDPKIRALIEQHCAKFKSLQDVPAFQALLEHT